MLDQPSHELVMLTVDLADTWEQQRVVIICKTTSFYFDEETMWCWRGNVYTTNWIGTLHCITTGQVTTSHKGKEVLASGRSPKGVLSVEEPTKLCHRHAVERRGSIHFAHELGVREPVCAKKNRYIEVVDAVSGFSIFKMRNDSGLRVWHVL
ncbi:hypothetical protein Pelo_19363 [Pelomyxa schiedti]|nr:hypothetical protein Pelo_19363 [Pelomyxa schiedti]